MNLSGLSAVGPGFQQGQMNMADLKAKAQAIQQAQMTIDAKKRELAGQAALFQGLPAQSMPPGNASPPGQMQQGQPQPPMPGQPSQPMMQPQPGIPAAFKPSPSEPVFGSRQAGPVDPRYSGQGMSGSAPTGPQQPPQGGQPPGSPQGQPQPGADVGQDLGPQAQMQIIAQIAQSIKQRSPGIDPNTLFEAVKQQISLMGALSQTQKQQLVLATDQIKAQTQVQTTQMRDDTSTANTGTRAATSKDIATGHDDTSKRNTDVRAQTQIATTNARIVDADNRLNQTQAAINARQDKSIQGRATNKAVTERTTLLKSQLSKAKQLLSQAVANGDPGKIAAAQQAANQAADAVIAFQTKVVGGQGGGATGGGQASRGPSPASLKGKPIWPSPDGKSWVYEDGSEAK